MSDFAVPEFDQVINGQLHSQHVVGDHGRQSHILSRRLTSTVGSRSAMQERGQRIVPDDGCEDQPIDAPRHQAACEI